MKATFTNDFHNTSTSANVPDNSILTVSQVRRIRKSLCGIPSCTCGGNLSERGKQRFEIEPNYDGTVKIVLRTD